MIQSISIRFRELISKCDLPALRSLPWVFLGILLSWNVPLLTPTAPGGDRDYWYLINVAFARHLDFGSSVSTTYGPLFFLTAPSVSSRFEMTASLIFWVLCQLYFFLLFCQVIEKSPAKVWEKSLWVAVLCAGVAFTPLSSVISSPIVFSLILGILYALGTLPKWGEATFPIAAGLLTAVCALNKFSVAGIVGSICLGCLIWGSKRLKAVALFTGVGGLTAVVIWSLGLRMSLASLFQYVRNSFTVGAGQSGAMGLEMDTHVWEYVPLWGGLLAVGVALVLLVDFRGWAIAGWIGIILAFVLIVKQGFVRHDAHSALVFACIAGICVVCALEKSRRSFSMIAALMCIVQIAAIGPLTSVPDPFVRTANFGRTIWGILSVDYRNSQMAGAAASIRTQFPIPASIMNKINGKSVYIEPFNYSISYAYSLNDAVLPTLLEYGAYNATLDRQNTAWFEKNATAPKFILRDIAQFTLDNRNPLWDSPRAKLAEACYYSKVGQENDWILLRRTANRCGAANFNGEQQVASGQVVPIPQRDGYLTIAQVVPNNSFGSVISSVFFRPPELNVRLKSDTSTLTYRLPTGHSGAPLIVSGTDYGLAGAAEGRSSLSINADSSVNFGFVRIKR